MGRAQLTSAIIETLAESGGGALAGYLDARFPGKNLKGVNYGTLAALVGVGVGLSGIGGPTVAIYAREIGGGAAAFELGKIVGERTTKSLAKSGALQAPRVSGAVGALPPRRGEAVTARQLQESFNAMRSMA